MPNQKTDINNNGGFSTDFIGMNWAYPEADYADARADRQEHENYIRGFLTFLATSPRVPENLRREMQQWGPARTSLLTTGGWPRQLYVREARRMVSDYVMTEHHCRGAAKWPTIPWAWPLTTWTRTTASAIVKNGPRGKRGRRAGAAHEAVSRSPIGAIVPKAAECDNLLVPVCLSASHIAYGSIRMEPVFMILGQSAATAACLAITRRVAVQKVDYAKLRARLLSDQQILAWPPPVPFGPAHGP